MSYTVIPLKCLMINFPRPHERKVTLSHNSKKLSADAGQQITLQTVRQFKGRK